MERHLGKLSISTTGLLGGSDSAAHGQQHQQQQRYSVQAQPQQERKQPSSVHHLQLASGDDPDGSSVGGGDLSGARQRTGRIRQERSSTWGGAGPRIGGYHGAASNGSETATAAELAETVDLRLQESPRTPRTPRAGGSPRYATTTDDQHHLAAISPRGTAGHQAVHSYYRRDRNPSGSGGLMVTEEDFRHHNITARDSGASGVSGGGDSSLGWQPPRSQNDVSARILQKYKTDSLRVETVVAPDQQQQQRSRGQQQSTAKLSKSHDGYIAPRRLPPIGGAAGGANGGHNDGDSGEELDDQEDDEDDNDRRQGHGGGGSQSSVSANHKGRTRTT